MQTSYQSNLAWEHTQITSKTVQRSSEYWEYTCLLINVCYQVSDLICAELENFALLPFKDLWKYFVTTINSALLEQKLHFNPELPGFSFLLDLR